MNPQIHPRRFYIGSAAIFWFFVALFIWLTFFIVLRADKDVSQWFRLFLPSYLSTPAFFAALLAGLIRNLSANAVPAWLITPPVFVLIGYFMLRYLFFGRFF